jgi:hypothetical protein
LIKNSIFSFQPSRHTKLEKADILELTVKHLQSIQNQQLSMAINIKPTIVEKFKTGFSDCADEVVRYVNRMEDVDSGIKQRLSNHLNNCIDNLQSFGGMFQGLGAGTDAAGLGAIYNRFFNETLKMAQSPANITPPAQAPIAPLIIQDNNNNNNRIQMNGVQLIPSRLPSGEFALVVPNTNQNSPYFTGDPTANPINSVFDLSMPRASAFNVILKGNRSGPVSPPLSPVSTSEANKTQQTPVLQIHINPQGVGDTYPTPPNENLLVVAGQSQYPQISSSTLDIKMDPSLNLNESGVGESLKRRSTGFDEEEFNIKKRMKVEPVEQRKEENSESMWRPW